VRQVYALARVLSELRDEPFPETRKAASDLIERFRRELGHPNPALEDDPRPSRRAPSEKTVAIREFVSELNAAQ